MRKTAFEVSLAVECGAVGQTVLHRTAEHGRGVDAAVGFGDDASVDRAGSMVGRGPVVLDGVAHDGQLLCVEPATQLRVGEQDFARMDVVQFPAAGQPRVVIGSDGVDHVRIDVVMPRQIETLGDDRADVVRAVRRVEGFVTGDDLRFDMVFQLFGWLHGAKISIWREVRHWKDIKNF